MPRPRVKTAYKNGIAIKFNIELAINAPNGNAYNGQVKLSNDNPFFQIGQLQFQNTKSSTWYIQDPGFKNESSVLAIHEIGHWSGLQDEYIAPWSKYQNVEHLPPGYATGIMGPDLFETIVLRRHISEIITRSSPPPGTSAFPNGLGEIQARPGDFDIMRK
jgi:hypothetical protein